MKVKVEFKKLYKDSILPSKAHESDVGFDLYVHSVSYVNQNGVINEIPYYAERGFTLEYGERLLIKCGFGMALPVGYEAQIRSRSGLALKHGVSVVNGPGTIDPGFRSEVGVILSKTTHLPTDIFVFKVGDRIAQMVIQKLPEVEMMEVQELSNPSERGAAGFGSSGQ